MKEFPEQIVKQAEELIEKHKEFADPDTKVSWDKPFANAVRAAIVSCEFTLENTVSFPKKKVLQIKAYLEGLL